LDEQDARVREHAINFGEQQSLVGILTDPLNMKGSPIEVGAILLNPGILHRVGPGRIYVKMARELAAIGFTVLRFDFSGIGDSRVRHDNLPFDKSSVDEAQAAMNLLESMRGIRQFVFLGGCSGARVSLATACCDPRVVGAILMNFPANAEDDGNMNLGLPDRRDEHYFLNFAIRDTKSWLKFLTGKANYKRIFEALVSLIRRQFGPEQAPAPEWLLFRQHLDIVVRRGTRTVFVSSQGDHRLHDLRQAGGNQLRELCSQGKLELVVIPRTDHTFSSLHDQERLMEVVRNKAGEILERIANQPAVLPVAPLEIARSRTRH
jgi:pimeloyl-ACP methyl ester carboxylesterase